MTLVIPAGISNQGKQSRLGRGGSPQRLFLIGLGILVLLGVVAAAAVFLPRYLQAQQDLSERILGVMRMEAAALPAYPEGRQTHYQESAARGPLIYIEYQLLSAGSCADMQAFYASAAPGAGWETSESPHTPSGSDLILSSYRKVADGHKLTLEIECRTDDTAYDMAFRGDQNVPFVNRGQPPVRHA